MHKRQITFTNFDDELVTETFYFNITATELEELNLKHGDFNKKVEELREKGDAYGIYEMFKEVVLKAYGEKSADGKRFIKTDEMTNGFEHSDAYSQLVYELAKSEEKMETFIKSVLPKQKAN